MADPKVAADYTADVLFLIDSSFDVTNEQYTMEKDFVKSISDSLNVAPQKSRSSVITYGDRASLVAKYDSYKTTQELKRLIDGAQAVGGARRIDRALDAASTMISESRKDAPKIVVLLTAGQHTRVGGSKQLGVAAKPLRDKGARIFVVAIGRGPVKNELRPIVKEEKDILTFPSYEVLKPQAPSVAKKLSRTTVGKQLSTCLQIRLYV